MTQCLPHINESLKITQKANLIMTPKKVNILAWLHVWLMEVINSYITMIIVKLHILQTANESSDSLISSHIYFMLM